MVSERMNLQGDLLGETQVQAERPGLTRAQLVERIVELNPTASPAFLGPFSEDSLAHYLEHLCVAGEPTTPWVRKGMVPGIVRREAAE